MYTVIMTYLVRAISPKSTRELMKKQVCNLIISVDENVAIKIVELSSINSPKMEELLKSEIDLLRSIDHPNVVKCYNVLNSMRNCYIITELC